MPQTFQSLKISYLLGYLKVLDVIENKRYYLNNQALLFEYLSTIIYS